MTPGLSACIRLEVTLQTVSGVILAQNEDKTRDVGCTGSMIGRLTKLTLQATSLSEVDVV